MQRRFSFAFVTITAIIALTFGTLAGGIAGGFAALVLDPDSPTGERTAENSDNPSPNPDSASAPSPASSGDDARSNDQSGSGEPVSHKERYSLIADIVEEVSPAVVTVVNEQRMVDRFFDQEDGFEDDPERAGVGTGFFITDDGYLVTNYHVVDGSDEITVIFHDGDEVDATLIGGDEFADVAVLKIDEQAPATVRLGDSESLRPGEQVIAIGSALGDYANSVTEGIVSALGRNLQIRPGFNMENMIQHSASINPGNSGGPLLNINGEVIGVNTAVVRSAGLGITVEGMGFAISSNTVQILSDELIEAGQLERPYVGVVYEPLTQGIIREEEISVEEGVIVRSVEPGTPAADAGIEEGDIITGIAGVNIDNNNPLINELFKYDVGETIEIELFRPSEDETLTIELTLAARPN